MSKLGLVLEGGAAKGAYEAGVIQAMSEAGIEFDAVSGASIGAINGAAYVQGGYEFLDKVWTDIITHTFFDISDDMIARFKKKDFDLDMLFYAGKKLTSLWEEIRTSYETASEYIQTELNENSVRKSNKDFGLVTYNMSDMKPVEIMKNEIPQGQMYEYLMASTSFPIFPAQIIDGKKYIDGSVFDNLPITLLAKNGYKKMVVVRVNTMQKMQKRKLEIDDLDLFYIAPEKDLGLGMSFSSEKILHFREVGYADGKAALANGLKEFLER